MENIEEKKQPETSAPEEEAGKNAVTKTAAETGSIAAPDRKDGKKRDGGECECGCGCKRRSFLSRFLLSVLFILMNALFVFGAVEIIQNYRYSDGKIESTQAVKVVEEESGVIDVAKNASPAVVSIIATAEVPQYETQYEQYFNFRIPSRVQSGTVEQQVGAGSGFLVSGDGYIVTNKHVVDTEDAKYTVILNDEAHKNEKVEAEIVAIDPNDNTDIAILKINKTDLPFLDLGDSDSLQVGQTAVAIGYALGEFDNTVSKGVVSGLHRSISAGSTSGGTETLKDLIQTDAAVNPGNSGGPLLDIDGNVIGVNVAMADAQSIGFAIPINGVKTSFEEVKASGTIKKEAKAFLGVRYAVIDAAVKENNKLAYDYGVIIARGENMTDLAITPGSPADKAGLVENDIILEVDGQKIDEDNLLSDLIAKHKPGEEVKLRISHRGEEKEITLTLGEGQ